MSLMPGQMISHYRIVEKIGAGGMGIVYKAEDTKLRRTVALKMLPPPLMADQDRRRRFLREARSAAAVTHQNIAAVYEIDESGDTVFIAMEYVEGDPVRKLVARGPLPVEKALAIATGIGEALAEAHAAHVVHRDLKPDNVKVTPGGKVKLLDFGLAKLRDERTIKALEESSQAPTRTPSLTLEGKLLGTPSYMSPEQARGKEVDYRSDIFSFGTTLYELVTGRVPFDGEGVVETLNAILHQPAAPASSINHEVPSRLEEILDKCLQKNPADRYQHTEDLLVDLRRASAAPSSPSISGRPREAPSRRRPWAVPALLLAAVAVYAALYWPHTPPERVRPRIALLPAAYEGPASGGYVSDILPMAISEGMRSFGDLQVAPYASSRNFAPDSPARTVGQELAVDWVVQGKVIGEADVFRVTIQVLSADGDTTLWRREIRGDAGTLVAGADGLAADIGAALGIDVSSSPARGRRDPRAMKLYLQGRRYLEGWDVANNYLSAEAAFREALALDDAFAEAHAMLAMTLCTHYAETKEPALITQAQREADRAVALAPSLPEARAAVGLVLLRRGKSAEAAEAFEHGLRLAPADDSLHKRIALAYERLDRDDDAERMYQRAIELRPTFWGHYADKGIFYLNHGRLDEAADLFRMVIQLHPDGDVGYLDLAAAHMLSGRYTDAEPLLRAAIKINPSHQAWNNLGVVHYANGNFEEAAAAWREAIGLGTGDVTVFTNLGEACRQLKRESEARRAYEQAVQKGQSQLAVNPDDDEARAMLATALAGLGRCDESRAQAARAVETHGTPYVFYYVAVAYSVCGDHAAALDHVARAIRAGILADIRTNPDLRPLLDDPSIKAILPDSP